MLTIVIPTLNEEELLPRLLDSVAQQSFQDFEVVVVDGGSTDRTLAIAAGRQDEMPLRTLEVGYGDISAQRNAGATVARGEWLLFVDADSVLLPYALERCDRFIAEHEVSLFTPWCRADTDLRGDALFALLANLLYEGARTTRRPLAPGPFTAIRKDVFERVGGYTEGLAYQEDLDLTFRVTRAGVPLHILRETLYEWSTRRVHDQGAFKMLFEWVFISLYVLVFRRPLKRVPGYVMGGQVYAADAAEVVASRTRADAR